MGIKAILIPAFIRKKLRFALNKEVDVVLDASGFAFGDQWGQNMQINVSVQK